MGGKWWVKVWGHGGTLWSEGSIEQTETGTVLQWHSASFSWERRLGDESSWSWEPVSLPGNLEDWVEPIGALFEDPLTILIEITECQTAQ